MACSFFFPSRDASVESKAYLPIGDADIRRWSYSDQRMIVGRKLSVSNREFCVDILPSGGFRRTLFHAAKAEMVGPGVDFAFAARADDVARAIMFVAKK